MEYISDYDLLSSKRNELEELAKDPNVERYLSLLSDTKELQEKLQHLKTIDEIVSYAFRDNNNEPCNHEIWLYAGSFKTFWYQNDEHSTTVSVNSEYDEDFEYNRYVCLECGSIVEEKNWKDFEISHNVLKNQNSTEFGTDYYAHLYYQALFLNDVKTAQNIVIEEFNKNKVKSKIL